MSITYFRPVFLLCQNAPLDAANLGKLSNLGGEGLEFLTSLIRHAKLEPSHRRAQAKNVARLYTRLGLGWIRTGILVNRHRLFFDRFPGSLPAVKTGRKIDRVFEPHFTHFFAGTRTSHSACTVNEIDFALVELGHLVGKFGRKPVDPFEP